MWAELLLVIDDVVPPETRFAFAVVNIGECALDCMGVRGPDDGPDRSGDAVRLAVNTLEPGRCVRGAAMLLVSIAASVACVSVSIQTAASRRGGGSTAGPSGGAWGCGCISQERRESAGKASRGRRREGGGCGCVQLRLWSVS